MSFKLLLALAIVCMCSRTSGALGMRNSCIRQNKVSSSLKMASTSGYDNNNKGLDALMKQAKLLPAIIGSAMIIINPFATPDAAHAARSGGRSGGSSFSSGGGSSRSYGTAMRGSSQGYSGYASRPMIGGPMIMPMYGGYGLSPFSFIPINFNLLVLGAVAYTIYSVLQNRMGSSDFSGFNDGDSGSLGGGVSVIKIQLGLDADWNERGNIMETLDILAQKNAAMSGRNDISRLLSDSALSLLRKQNDWNSAAYESSYFNQVVASKGQPLFQQLAIKERSKFEEEKGSESMPLIKSSTQGKTQAVVSIIAAVRGKSSGYLKAVSGYGDARACLQGLAADALVDDGQNIMGVEILWTPVDRGDCLSDREIIADYPELIKL